jgi:acyl-CoA reductase-like NAD-dependent aldehyde dehydrogenase
LLGDLDQAGGHAGADSSVLTFSRADEAVGDAAAAYWNWSTTRPDERRDMLAAMAASLGKARDQLRDVAAAEIGAAPKWIDFNIRLAQETLHEAGNLLPLLEDRIVDDAVHGTRSILRRQPVGVVLGFAPWNAPIALSVRAVAAPLACGNTVVLKASEHCPQTQSLVIDILRSAGLPQGVATVVSNKPEESSEVARRLISHPAVRRINFTGSTRVGRMVAEIAASELKRCLLELSGKSALIVTETADLDTAVSAAALGAFFNQGQICMSTERIVVFDEIADAFVGKLVDQTRSLKAADPRKSSAPLGRLINANAADRIRGLIDDAISKGAVLLTGGEVDGAVMQPAVLDRVTSTMRLYHEESFGPVACVLRVSDAEEAISIANDTEFGLSAAVFGADIDRCMDIATRLETGICQINGPTVYDNPAMPFGGMKASGYGRFGGPASIDEFTELRWIAQHKTGVKARTDDLLT